MKIRDFVIILAAFALLLFAAPQVYGFMGGGAGEYKRREITLLRTETGGVSTLTAAEYVTGCLLAQIPINYSEEALRAQAVCAYTYAMRFIEENEKAESPQVTGADISDNPAFCQPFFSESEARELYGEDYDLYIDKVRAAAEYGAGRLIIYANEPIYAVYHSVSAGETCTGKTVWGMELPYLAPVASPWDKEYDNFLCKNEMTVEAARQKLVAAYPDITVPADYAKWFGGVNANESGYVSEIKLGSLTLTGGDVWRVFGLRSTAFTVEYKDSVFLFTTRGYGHGAGLSQYGAEALAGRGYSAEEILKYYFSGAEII